MARLTENESVIVLDSLRKYRGIVKLTDTPKSIIQELDTIIQKIEPQECEPTTADDYNAKWMKEEETRNGASCINCE